MSNRLSLLELDYLTSFRNGHRGPSLESIRVPTMAAAPNISPSLL